MATYSVKSVQGMQSFQSNLTLDQATQVIIGNMEGSRIVPWSQKTRDFATDLVRAARQWGAKLTPGRQAWVLKLAQEVLDAQAQVAQAALLQAVGAPATPAILPVQAVPASPQPAPAPAQPAVRMPHAPVKPQIGNFADIVSVFGEASKHLKYPRITLQTALGQDVSLQVAGQKSRYPGAVHVSDGIRKSNGGKYFGRIDMDGSFDTMYPNQDVIDLLKRFAQDPAGVAADYGRLTGACCFCKIPLTDERSTSVGYGPICADHYGLPWGSRPGKLTLGTPPELSQPVASQPVTALDQDGFEDMDNSIDEAWKAIGKNWQNSQAPASRPASDELPTEQVPDAGTEPQAPPEASEELPEVTEAALVPEPHEGCSYYKCTNPSCSMYNRLFQAMPKLDGANRPRCGQGATRSTLANITVPASAPMKPNFPLGVASKTASKSAAKAAPAKSNGKGQPQDWSTMGAVKEVQPTTGILTTVVKDTTISYQLLDYPRVRLNSDNPEWDEEYKRTTGSNMDGCSPHEMLQFIRWVHNHS